MSDSDDDLLQRDNIFTYANDNTTIYAQGPNVNKTNMTGLSLRNNVLPSTMRMPVNFERQRYAGSHYDQRSMYYRREMSPMSLRGASDFGSRNFNHSTYKNGMGCQSMYNGRSGSPFSVRSIDSTATVSAVDIAFAFKNIKFDSHDLRIIKEAYKQLIKPHRRKRIEKRRNLRLLLKKSRRKSGEDSGEQGSDSSISSDDSRSIKTTICNENVPQSHLSSNIKDNQIVRDCTENIKQNTLKNMFPNSRPNYSAKELIQNTSVLKLDRNPSSTLQNISIMTQKERFKRGFLLPSQRFNKTVNGTIHENNKTKLINGTRINNVDSCSKMAGPESDSGTEEIFRRLSDDTNPAISINRKRALDTEDVCSNRKRSRLHSHKQGLPNAEPVKVTSNSNGQSNDFIFAKPKMPVMKSDTKNIFAHEKLLAKSRVPSIAEENDPPAVQTNNHNEKNNNEDIENETHLDIQHGTSDVSMRPSFIKRKLFTQKLDVAENKNISCDSVATNSPQNVYTEALRERNKARKLVTSQSCLSRDIAGEDSNVLDLIHKIVPPDQINTTKTANKTDLSTNKSNNVHNDDKWDVTSAILNCNSQDVSDTYTDEEIFNITFKKESANKDKLKKVAEKPKPVLECKIVVEKLNSKTADTLLKNNNNYELPHSQTNKAASKKRVTDCVKSFWDTDFESDMEGISTLKTNTQKFQGSIQQKKNNDCPEPKLNITKKGTIAKGNILNVRNCHKEAKLNISLRSQKDQTVKDKIFENNDKPNSIAKTNMEVTTAGDKDKNKLNNKKHNFSEKKVTDKENVTVINKKQDSGRQTKVKKCTNCNDQNQSTNTTKKANVNDKLKQKNENVKQSAQKSNNKSICIPEPKEAKKGANNKTTKSATNCNVKPQNTNMNVRKQPKRKSKEKSFNQSPKPRQTLNNTKATIISNNSIKSKLKKDSVLKNSSLNSLNTRTTRSSREKLAFDSSGCDQSSVNISNISNRSLRLRQRNLREYNMYPMQ